MFVITADQIDSRNDQDRASEMVARLDADYGHAFALPPDQTSGDEIQVMMPNAATAIDVILTLHHAGRWSIGLGIGGVRTPLPASTRKSAGGAFIGARNAVTRAKKADARFALEIDRETEDPGAAVGADSQALNGSQVEAVVTMLLVLRQRRTSEGWEAVELLQRGLTQVEIAAELGISTAAVSQRVKTALWRVDEAVQPVLIRLLENLDRATSETEPAA